MNSGIGIIWAPVSAGTLVIWGLGIFVAVVGMVWFESLFVIIDKLY